MKTEKQTAKRLDEQEIMAVRTWLERQRNFAPLKFDERVKKFESDPRQETDRDWIECLLQGAGFSYQMMGEKLKTSRQDIQQTEARENSGQVTLKKMQQIAAAAGCNFVYAIVPKSKADLTSEIIRRSAEFLELHAITPQVGAKSFTAAVALRLRRFLAKPTGWGIVWGYAKAKQREYKWYLNDTD